MKSLITLALSLLFMIGCNNHRYKNSAISSEDKIMAIDVSKDTKNVIMPRFKKVSKPEYTPKMEVDKVEGVVKVKILIDKYGKVHDYKIIEDLGPESVKSLEKAFKTMQFHPAYKDGNPIAVWVVLEFNFDLIE